MKLYGIIFIKLQQMMNVLYYYIYLFNVKCFALYFLRFKYCLDVRIFICFNSQFFT